MYGKLFDPEDIPAELRQYFEEVDARCGKPYVRATERTSDFTERPGHPTRYGNTPSMSAKGFHMPSIKPPQVTTLGFAPSCACNAGTVPGVVLDPFMGSGTVALVARRLGRSYIGCDLSSEYVALCNQRLAEPYTPPMPLDAPAPTPAAVQEALL